MNEVIQNILNRRSIRVYSSEQIRFDDMELLLRAGYNAPSGCNEQPWHFTVVQNKELINELNVESKKCFQNSDNETFRKMAENENYNIFYNAPSIIVVSGEEKAITAPIDCAAATQNILLAAESLGIGTCWIGLVTFLFESNKADLYLKKLQIPEGYKPYYAVSMGYKKYPNPKAQPRRDNIISYIK